MIELIIIDFDGTLGDTRRNIVTTMQMTIREFTWLYIGADTLKQVAENNDYMAEVVAEGEHYDYLARITKNPS